MTITSSAFSNNEHIPTKYTCDGENISPPLTFSDVPKEAKSLVLIVEDLDAPKTNFTHWVVFDIPASLSEVMENEIPNDSFEGLNDAGSVGYTGPCPPSGTHRYIFKLYALAQTLGLAEGATKNEVQEKMKNYVLETVEITGLYQRSL